MKAYELAKHLNDEEPDYIGLAVHDEVTVAMLSQLMKTADPALAARLACLAGHIKKTACFSIIRDAARHPNESVRVGAAIGVCRMLTGAGRKTHRDLVTSLLSDPSVAVRKAVVMSLCSKQIHHFRRQIRKLSASDPDRFVKAAAAERLGESSLEQSIESGVTSHILGDELQVVDDGALLMTSDELIVGDDQIVSTNAILPGAEI